MKKFFFFAAALVASVTVNAQTIEVFNTKDSSVAIDTAAVEIAAGTSIYAGTNFDVAVKFTDSYKSVNTYANNYKTGLVGSTAIDFTMGIQGAGNPKDVDGGNPGNTLLIPASGAVYSIKAKADGKIIVVHKASANKQYCVWENGSLVGYDFAMQAPDSIESSGVLRYTLAGNEENYNYVDANHLTVTVSNNYAFEASQKIEQPMYYFGCSSFNAVGVIAFDAFTDAEYLVHATGSKISAANIIFVGDNDSEVVVTLDGSTLEDETVIPALQLYTVPVPSALNNVEGAVKAQKVIRNGQVLILKNGVKYTVLGTVAE